MIAPVNPVVHSRAAYERCRRELAVALSLRLLVVFPNYEHNRAEVPFYETRRKEAYLQFALMLHDECVVSFDLTFRKCALAMRVG